jgi:D-tyrosyl-tRNA(Tyr) deacylase
MRAIVQRVSKAKVTVDNVITGKIQKGLLVLLAISQTDTFKEIEWMANKLVNLRIFSDEQQKMNKSVLDNEGAILIVSNFTLYGSVERGFRPSFTGSAPAEFAEKMYDEMVKYMREIYPVRIETGIFGAMMDVELINDGPVTLIIDKDANT